MVSNGVLVLPDRPMRVTTHFLKQPRVMPLSRFTHAYWHYPEEDMDLEGVADAVAAIASSSMSSSAWSHKQTATFRLIAYGCGMIARNMLRTPGKSICCQDVILVFQGALEGAFEMLLLGLRIIPR